MINTKSMFLSRYLLTFMFINMYCLIAGAQQISVVKLGSIKGTVRDTTRNYVLKSATASVFRVVDTTLLTYRITNTYGEFALNKLPLNIPLKLEISHVGYITFSKNFMFTKNQMEIDFGSVSLEPTSLTLEDVVISIPPVSLNGDTLEFNAGAFKLDSNATVEDMLRAVPNVTLWGDGSITVNGGQIKKLKVNGKDFFGGDFQIAIQNLAKSALQKVQVYKTNASADNPLDSTMEMNLKLKKGKDFGYFGKVNAGLGTDKRNEFDANINIFSPKLNLAIVGSVNNVNKAPGNVETLMANSTFKGVGTRIDYQPDFQQQGARQSKMAGALFNYNFIERPDFRKKNVLVGEYYAQHNNIDNSSDLNRTSVLDTQDRIMEMSKTTNLSQFFDQRFSSSYELLKNEKYLGISQMLNHNRGSIDATTLRSAFIDENVLASTNNTISTNNFENRKLTLRGEYRKSPSIGRRSEKIKRISAIYQFDGEMKEDKKLNITDFRSTLNPAENRKFDRKYETQIEDIKQQIEFEFGGFKESLFGKKKFWGIDFAIRNKVNLNSEKRQDKVQDLDTLISTYKINSYLTNRVQTFTFRETPDLIINKAISKRLSDRFDTNSSFNFFPNPTFIMYQSKSETLNQNIKRKYFKFLPDVNISFNNNQYGIFRRSYNLTYSTEVNIPTIQQLAPLTDSTNVYYIQKGNIKLNESITKKLTLSFDHNDQHLKNPLGYNFQISAGTIQDNIIDSILVDNQNRRTIYLVNAPGNKFFEATLGIKKPLKLTNSELQFDFRTQGNITKNPIYINNFFTIASNLNTNSQLTISYIYNFNLAVTAIQSYSSYRSNQKEFNNIFSGVNSRTTLSSSYNVTRKFTLSTNLTFHSSSSSNNTDIKYSLWNASAVYRFLKGNNGEFKLSALDLLHQNTGIINYSDGNSFAIGRQNVLKQYFMVNLSYYPRQFGKKQK